MPATTKQPTEAQRHALKNALSKAYWEGWDGKTKLVDTTHHAPCMEAGRRRYTNRVVVPTPTATALERQGLVTDYYDSGWLFALTDKGIALAEAELRKLGANPKEAAAEQRAKEAAARKKQDEEFDQVVKLFDKFSIIPTGKKTSMSVAKLVRERGKEQGQVCFDMNELEQIGLFLPE